MNPYSLLFIVFLVTVLGGCGSSSSSNVATSPSFIASLPKITAPATDAARVFVPQTPIQDSNRSASTGVKLGSLTSTTWNSSRSATMCSTGRLIRDLVSLVSRNDGLVCRLGALEAAGAMSNSYDGTAKYFKFDNWMPGKSSKFKVQAKKTSAGFETFKLWGCHYPQDNNSLQDIYLSYTFSNGVSLVAGLNLTIGGIAMKVRTTASGNTTTSGDWNGNKTISNLLYLGDATTNVSESMTLIQGTNKFTLSGFVSGLSVGTPYTDQHYAVVQGLGLSALSTAAIGDGTSKSRFTYSNSETAAAQARSWNGDTQAPISAISGDYYAAANAGTLPTITSVDPSFQSGETWDCAGDFTTVNYNDFDAAVHDANVACTAAYDFNYINSVDCNSGSYN